MAPGRWREATTREQLQGDSLCPRLQAMCVPQLRQQVSRGGHFILYARPGLLQASHARLRVWVIVISTAELKVIKGTCAAMCPDPWNPEMPSQREDQGLDMAQPDLYGRADLLLQSFTKMCTTAR